MATKLFCLGLALCCQPAMADDAASTGGICLGKPQVSPHCHWIRGKVAVYNGTPSIRIRQGRKVFGVGPVEEEWMPPDLKAKLTPENEIDARMRICPFAKPGGMPMVCIDQAEALKITRP
jgi:hypothetical protein